MINKDLKLNKDIFSSAEKIPIRKGYGEGLVNVAKEDDRIVALCADLTESTNTHLFKKEFPDRFIEMGIGEQSMASVASGLAHMGKIPFFTSYSMFSPGRNWEQIRTTICYNDANAKIVGSHAGVSVGPDGGTHQAIEDIAITRVIPRMTVLVPTDAIEAKKATIAAAKHKGPVYIRLQREATPTITTDDTPFEIGKMYKIFDAGEDVLLFACGGVVHTALLAAKELNDIGVKCSLYNCPTIKPLDKDLLNYIKDAKTIFTIEEHQRSGGLGSAISEVVSENNPKKIVRIGVDDTFGQSGTPDELLNHYGLSKERILQKIKDNI